jgi:putative ABC transport system permease protein
MGYLREALDALAARRLQLFLATFGVGVGVASMVFLVAVVSGVHRMVQEQFRLRGAGLLEVSMQPPRRTLTPQSPPVRLTAMDADILAFGGPALGRTTVRRFISGQNARFGPQETAINLQAVSETYFELARTTLASGRPLTRDDLVSRRRVIVLGAGIARELFGEDDALGQAVRIGDWTFDVVGVVIWLAPSDDPQRISGIDRQSYIPYTTAHETFVHPEQADTVMVEIASADVHAEAAAAVKAILIHRHGLKESQGEWVRVFDSVERTREMNMIMTAIKTLVGIVGGVALFVGAVGVMNIMIVSVTQRTSEIGLRRAVGAPAWWIRRQFLIESVLVTSVGGCAGLVLAALLSWGVQHLPIDQEVPRPYVSLLTVAIALGVILLTGILAGLMPAVRASRITPVEALRHE